VTKKSPIACTRTAKLGDKVSVHYVVSLENGEEIDTSLDKDKPLTLTLGQGQMIKGFELGILGMCFAEERRVTIPPHLAYGDKEMGPIPPKSVLVFDVQLVGINTN